jgi:hypothetical protein
MQVKSHLSLLLTCAVVALTSATQVRAADDKKVDATGTWTWSTPGRNGGEPRKMTLKIKSEGEKLVGTIAAPGRQGGEPRETPVEALKVKGDEITFNVVREVQGNKLTSKYAGKISGDTIKGKIETERNGNARSNEWEAKRETAKKA